MLKEGDVLGIFAKIGDDVEIAEDGTFILKEYTPFIRGKSYTFSDLGIN